MDVIQVPATPRKAFNKNRRMSDLIRAQIEHFHHLEQKMPAALQSGLDPDSLVTEADAARYVAHMTQALLNKPAPKKAAGPMLVKTGKSVKSAAPALPREGLAIAASGNKPVKKATPRKPAKKVVAKKSAGKKGAPTAATRRRK
jgi:hypothetical protein